MLGHVGGPQMPTLADPVQGSSSMGIAGAGPCPQPLRPPILSSQTFTIWKQQRQNSETRQRKPLIPRSILDMFLLEIKKINLCVGNMA